MMPIFRVRARENVSTTIQTCLSVPRAYQR
jgi:hypothetical protein